MFFRNKKEFGNSGAPEWLIVGLGNPGQKYEFTRHNSGFLCLDLLADKLGVRIDRLRFKSLLCDVKIGDRRCLLMKPQTFMNNSGEAVRDAADFYKIPPENVLVIYDDYCIDIGKLRIRRKGSDGGHNGIKSIIYHLNSDAFPRIKLGIGKPDEHRDAIDWVLSRMSDGELKELRPAADNACAAAELIIAGDLERAMALYN